MNKLEFTEIPNTKGKYGINKEGLIIDFAKGRYIVPFGEDRKRVKVVYNGERTSKGVKQLFELTFGLEKHDNPEHPIFTELRQIQKEFNERVNELLKKFQ